MPRVRGSGTQDGAVLVDEVAPVVVEAAAVVEAAPMVEAMLVVKAVLVVEEILRSASIDAGAQLANSMVRMKASSREK